MTEMRTEEFEDEDRIVRVSMLAMDGLDPVQRAVAAASAPEGSYARYCADAAADRQRFADLGSQAGHRPGSAPLGDAERQARAKAVHERNTALADAWKQPTESEQQAEEPPRKTAADAQAAYEERNAALRDSWRST